VEHKINLSFTLPVSQAEKVLAFVRSFGSADPNSGAFTEVAKETPGVAPMQAEPVPLHQQRPDLGYLLDRRLEQVVSFIVRNAGKFYNDELASELGVDDPQTSTFLGHLTRKLRKTGIQAEGFRGANWYSKIRRSGRTRITVREDVLSSFSKAIES
jgi:hypothetical protein